MVAKIGHSFAAATLGLDSFRPLLLDLILGKSKHVTYLVGGTEIAPTPIPGPSYRINLYNHTLNDRHYLMARVHLFANNGAPYYTVAVGETDRKAAPDGVFDE
jgi:hypothetical protein